MSADFAFPLPCTMQNSRMPMAEVLFGFEIQLLQSSSEEEHCLAKINLRCVHLLDLILIPGLRSFLLAIGRLGLKSYAVPSNKLVTGFFLIISSRVPCVISESEKRQYRLAGRLGMFCLNLKMSECSASYDRT